MTTSSRASILNLLRALDGGAFGRPVKPIEGGLQVTGDLTLHGFAGDTLIYYADNNGDSMNFIGTVPLRPTSYRPTVELSPAPVP